MDIELLISQYMDGELSSEEEAELHHALALSPEARVLFREHLTLQGVARDERVLHRPSDDMRDNLFARLQSEEGMKPVAAVASLSAAVASHGKPERAAVPQRAGDRPPVAAAEHTATEERRRRRRLIPILIPFVICMIAGTFWLSGGFSSPGDDGRQLAALDVSEPQDNAASRTQSETRSDAEESELPESDEENVPVESENADNGLIAMNTEVRRSVAPESPRNNVPSLQMGETVRNVRPAGQGHAERQIRADVDGGDMLALDVAPRVDHDVLGEVVVETEEQPSDRSVDALSEGQDLAYSTRSGRGLIAEENTVVYTEPEVEPAGDDESASVALNSEPSEAFADVLADYDELATADDAEWSRENNYGRGSRAPQALVIDRTPNFFSGRVFDSATGQTLRLNETNYVEIGEMIRNLFMEGNVDSGAVTVFASPSSSEESEEYFRQSVTVENDTIVQGKGLIASSSSKHKDYSPRPLGEDASARRKGAVQMASAQSDVPLDEARSTTENHLQSITGWGRSTLFVGLEQRAGISLSSTSSAESALTALPLASSGETVFPSARLKFGVVLDGGRHMVFAALGAAAYTRHTSVLTRNTSRQVRNVIDPNTSGLRPQLVNTVVLSSEEREENAWDFNAGVGYRYSTPLASDWLAGAEAFAGAGPNYLHASLSLPFSYYLARTLRLEFSPGLAYQKALREGQIVTKGEIDQSASLSNYEQRLEVPRESQGIQAMVGIGLILLLD